MTAVNRAAGLDRRERENIHAGAVADFADAAAAVADSNRTVAGCKPG